MTGQLVLSALAMIASVGCSIKPAAHAASKKPGECCAVIRYTIDPTFTSNEVEAIENGVGAWSRTGRACIERNDNNFDIAILHASSRIEMVGDDADYKKHVGYCAPPKVWIVSEELSQEEIENITSHEVGHAWGLPHSDGTGSIMTPIVGSLIRSEGHPPTLPKRDLEAFENLWNCK